MSGRQSSYLVLIEILFEMISESSRLSLDKPLDSILSSSVLGKPQGKEDED